MVWDSQQSVLDWKSLLWNTRSFHLPSPHGLNDRQKSLWGWSKSLLEETLHWFRIIDWFSKYHYSLLLWSTESVNRTNKNMSFRSQSTSTIKNCLPYFDRRKKTLNRRRFSQASGYYWKHWHIYNANKLITNKMPKKYLEYVEFFKPKIYTKDIFGATQLLKANIYIFYLNNLKLFLMHIFSFLI